MSSSAARGPMDVGFFQGLNELDRELRETFARSVRGHITEAYTRGYHAGFKAAQPRVETNEVIYDLIVNASVEEIGAFISARDDVRAMVSGESPPSSVADTIPLPSSTTAPPSKGVA